MSGSGFESCVLLIGGSFNPPHIGHLRIAIEAWETLRPSEIVFIPTAIPPHKPDACLLPFSLRVEMLQNCLATLPKEWNMSVSEVENERTGASYTVDTLAILAERHPGKRLAFAMGGEDYANLSSWNRWYELTRFADLIIVPRKEHSEESFAAATRLLWPNAVPFPHPSPLVTQAFRLPDEGMAIYLPQPLLLLSSSLVRERFLSGRSLDFLVPEPVRLMVARQKDMISSFWEG